ncbi:hypothetical protein MTR67_023303 [Solanum verrucosum]|uniref:Uncharacterized protein n=1 Tax=Solanum verrucosum TaxID=315347 RepID=A0AAF0TYJ7_SOLVR|nr:hypothetical protein MTR67_023303 [Solanum verrucosum]
MMFQLIFFSSIATTFFLFHYLPMDNIKHQQHPRLLDRGETCRKLKVTKFS